MKIECVKDVLEKAVYKADKITGKNLNLPVLSCILFSVKNKKLYIKSTNLDLGIEIFVPAKIEIEGDIAIPSGVLNSYLAGISSRTVILESKDGVILISSDNGKTSIKSMSSEDFPIIPKLSHDVEFDINSKDFSVGLKSVWYSASPSSIKPELSSVYVYQSSGKLVFVATDSFRLAEKQIPFTQKSDFPPVLIPFKNIPEIIRVLEGEGMVKMIFTKNQIAFVGDTIYLTSRVVEGSFPDYKRIIPKESVAEAVVLKEDIISVLHTLTIFTDKFNQIYFSLNPKEKFFELKARNADLGESVERMPAALSGEKLDIGLNYRYIADAFQSINSDSISLFFGGVQKPLVIKGVSDNTFLYIVMPMNR